MTSITYLPTMYMTNLTNNKMDLKELSTPKSAESLFIKYTIFKLTCSLNYVPNGVGRVITERSGTNRRSHYN